jgi:hypothetical protein
MERGKMLLPIWLRASDRGSGGLPIADLLTMMGIYIMFAYLEGGVIALLAGFLMSMWMIWHAPGFVGTIIAALGSVCLYRLAAELGILSPGGASLVRNNFSLTLVLAAMPLREDGMMNTKRIGGLGFGLAPTIAAASRSSHLCSSPYLAIFIDLLGSRSVPMSASAAYRGTLSASAPCITHRALKDRGIVLL